MKGNQDMLLLSLVMFGATFYFMQVFVRMDNIGLYSYRRFDVKDEMEKLAQDDFNQSENGAELRNVTENLNNALILPYMNKENWEIAYERYAEVSKDLTRDYRALIKTQKISMIDHERDATRLAVEGIEKAGEKWK